MVELIAETAWHHEGDLDFMKRLIEELISNSKADIIKLHLTLDIDEYISKDHLSYDFLKQRLFSEKQWEAIIIEIQKSDKKVMLLLNDQKAIEFGMEFNPALVEIHSVCLNDIHLLKKLKSINTSCIPVVLGIGGSTLYEIENAIACLNTKNIILMHGFQNYPTRYHDINFNKTRKIMQLYPNYRHGYADHTAWNEPNNILITDLGAALGMKYIEKHVTIEPGVKRTDWQAAISIADFNLISEHLKVLEDCCGNGELKLNNGEEAYSFFGPNKKAAILIRNINKGELLTEKDFTFKRTAQTSRASQLDVLLLLGKRSKSNLSVNSIISKEDFE